MSGSLGHEMKNKIEKKKYCKCNIGRDYTGIKKCGLCGKKIGRPRNKREPYTNE